MADILIRGTSVSNLIGKVIEIGYDAADCLYAFVDNGATDILEAIELPEHGDLVDRSELNNLFESSDFDGEQHDNVYSAICVVNSMPVIVPSNKENKNAN